jgi:hypothetical protein
MESMALGVPVIATGWSGNMDFMDDTNAALVAFSLVPVVAAHDSEYRLVKGRARWAEPDCADAARAMRELADNASRRAALGQAARASMMERSNRYLEATALADVLRLAETGSWRGPHRRRVVRLRSDAHLRAVAPGKLIDDGRKLAITMLRRLGLKPPPPGDERPAGRLREIDPYSL